MKRFWSSAFLDHEKRNGFGMCHSRVLVNRRILEFGNWCFQLQECRRVLEFDTEGSGMRLGFEIWYSWFWNAGMDRVSAKAAGKSCWTGLQMFRCSKRLVSLVDILLCRALSADHPPIRRTQTHADAGKRTQGTQIRTQTHANARKYANQRTQTHANTVKHAQMHVKTGKRIELRTQVHTITLANARRRTQN